MTEQKSQAKQKFHCACATGDLSAIEPVVAPADETAAKPDGSDPSMPTADVAPAVDKQKTNG